MIYILELEHGKYYVGATDRQSGERLLEHFAQQGAEWTRLHRPVRAIEMLNCGFDREDEITLATMERYGWWNVRGGRWCNVVMTEPPPELAASPAIRSLPPQAVWCRRCLRTSHTTDLCYAKTDARGQPLHCSRCGRTSHVASNCYARTTVTGKELPPNTTPDLFESLTQSQILTAPAPTLQIPDVTSATAADDAEWVVASLENETAH